ncbi:hypothetical protein E2562_032575 [Oryza meyeriana var. granulata]|uniref:Uncharacterized protein n=1 Tax=Oryza meyeriana var. granulata TaxID=110450 RepID=A0A6G1ECD5_9ORYZ|nr:hypothetical protein E2562_032575 [Oryza meyeriana var. granulata]
MSGGGVGNPGAMDGSGSGGNRGSNRAHRPSSWRHGRIHRFRINGLRMDFYGTANLHGGEDHPMGMEEMASYVEMMRVGTRGIEFPSTWSMSLEWLVEASGVQVEDGAADLAGGEDGSSVMEVEDQAAFMEAVAIDAAIADMHAGINLSSSMKLDASGVQKVNGADEDTHRPVFLAMIKIMLPEYFNN